MQRFYNLSLPLLIILNDFYFSMESQEAIHNLKSFLYVFFWEFLGYEHTMFFRRIQAKGDIVYLIKDITFKICVFHINPLVLQKCSEFSRQIF